MLCALGARELLVGRSHVCDFPAGLDSVPTVTNFHVATACEEVASSHTQGPTDSQATRTADSLPNNLSLAIDRAVRRASEQSDSLYCVDVETVLALQPDVIVTQSLCDVCAVSTNRVAEIVESASQPIQIVSLTPNRIADVYECISEVAQAIEHPQRGERLIAQLKQRVQSVRDGVDREGTLPGVVFLEWLFPFFSAGHWNPELVEIAGGKERIGVAGEKSKQISLDDLHRADPDFIAIACCGYTVEHAERDLAQLDSDDGWRSLRAVRTNQVDVFDGSAYFNRPGPRLIDGLEALASSLKHLRG